MTFSDWNCVYCTFFQNAVQDPLPYQYLKSNSLQTQISPSRQCWICLFFTTKGFMNSAVWISALYYLMSPSRLGISNFQLPEIAQKAARSTAHRDVYVHIFLTVCMGNSAEKL